MANPTTNYGWPMPTTTDLVTDLPADFAAFGQPVDTSLKALNPETTLGDIAYRSSTSNTNTRLGIGSTGQVLTVASGVPSWASIAASGLVFIRRTTYSAVSSQAFDTVFSSTYKTYFVVVERTTGSTDNNLQLQFRDAGGTVATGYYGQSFGYDYTSAITNTATSAGSALTLLAAQGASGTRSSSAQFYVTYVGEALANGQHSGISGTGFIGNGTKSMVLGGGQYSNNQNHTGFILSASSGTITGQVTVYGLATS
jgi:hypothetical protein